MTTFPELYLEIDVTTTNVLADPGTFTWTRIYPRNETAVTIERGQNMELSRIEPGRMVALFDNRDRRWDPTYTSSPYYGKVTPMRPMRARAVASGTSYTLFTGFTDRFTPKWGEGGSRDHTVEIECVDGLDYLGRCYLGLEPLLTWTTTQTADSFTTFYDITGGRRMRVRLGSEPAGNVTISTRGAQYGTGSLITEVLTLSPDNWAEGVTGSIAYTSLTRLTTGGADFAGMVVEVGLMPSFPAARSDIHAGWALDIAGWPTAARSLGTGQSTLTLWDARVPGGDYRQSSLAEDGDNVLSALQRITESESGVLFANGAGVVVFQSRTYRIFNRTPVATLGSGAGEIPITLDRPPSIDSANICNIARVTPATGGTQVASDATSIAAYGRRPWAKGGLLISKAEAQDLASYTVYRGKTPRPRAPAGWVQGQDGLWATLLGAEIGQAYTLRQRPPNVGGAVDSLVFLEAITLEIQRGSWRARWGFSSDPGTFWILGTSALDSTTVAGY